MKDDEEKLKACMTDNRIEAAHLVFETSCHTVAEAAASVQGSPADFVKNICMIDTEGRLIIAIVKGEDRVSTKKIGQVLEIPPPRTATQDEIQEKTGYPCGGVPSFGYEGIFLIDSRVMERAFVYTGGGSPRSLVKISPSVLQAANKGLVVKIRK